MPLTDINLDRNVAQAAQKVLQIFFLKLQEEDERKLSLLFKEIGLTPTDITFERGCYGIQLQIKQALPWIIDSFLHAQVLVSLHIHRLKSCCH